MIPDGFWLWKCFTVLNGQRHAGQSGPQPITIADIAALAMLEGLDHADTVWMSEVVIILDRVWLEEVYKQIKKQQEDADKKAKSKANARRGR